MGYSDIFLHNTNILGKLYLNYGSQLNYGSRNFIEKYTKKDIDHYNVGLKPMLQNKIVESYSQYNVNPSIMDFIPGYLDVTKSIFFKCPVSIGYLQLDLIKFFVAKTQFDKHRIIIDLVLFSKDLSTTRDLSISQEIDFGNGMWEKLISNIINVINLYIDADNEINDINQKLFEPEFKKTFMDDRELINIINNLDFKYYTDQTGAPGKDTRYWLEVDISNFPKSKYLQNIFISILDRQFLGGYDKETDIYNFSFNDEYCPGVSRWGGRKVADTDNNKSDEIKDYIKLNIMIKMDSVKELIEHLIVKYD